MARPTKQGVDYFPVDVEFDGRLDLFVAETGAAGWGVLVGLWQLIYKDYGYYADYTEDLFLILRRRLMVDIEEAKSIIDRAVARGLFDADMFHEHQILTSRGIQKRYFIAAKKKKGISVDGNYLCMDVSDVRNVSVFNSNGVKGDGNPQELSFSKNNSSGNATKEEEEEEVKEEEEVEEDSETVSGDVINSFVLQDNTEFLVTKTILDEYKTTYPDVNHEAELRKIRQWCKDNPEKRKTKRGARKFLNSWFSRAQEAASKNKSDKPKMAGKEYW